MRVETELLMPGFLSVQCKGLLLLRELHLVTYNLTDGCLDSEPCSLCPYPHVIIMCNVYTPNENSTTESTQLLIFP